MLRRSDLFGPDGYMRYPPRLPHEPLPSFVTEADREAQVDASTDGDQVNVVSLYVAMQRGAKWPWLPRC